MGKLRRLTDVVRQRGLRYGVYYGTGVLVPKARYQMMRRWPSQQARIAALGGLPLRRVGRMQNAARRLQVRQSGSFTRWEAYPVSADFRQKVDALTATEIVLGHIDNDGRLQSDYGALPFAENVSTTNFVPRRRFPLDIVLRDGCVLIRKDFRGDKQRFSQEWHNVTRLQAHANVPALHSVNEEQTLLYKNYVLGRTIRDIVVDAGAKILTVQTENDPELAKLEPTERLYAVLQRGLDRFPECFSEQFISAIEAQINAIHAQGIAKLSLTFGNIMVDADERPWFIDLESSEAFTSTDTPLFQLRRDQDREKFNRIYGQNVLTEAGARKALRAQVKKLGGWYAPIDFGNGLTIDGIHSIESGTGRWEYLNKRVMTPLLQGKRVLDLGCNNGIMPMMMLKAGAQRVTGIELFPKFVDSAELVRSIFEWRDMRDYKFDIIQANMTEILTADWGEFDVITSLCTLYYLEAEEMAAVVQKAAELAPVMILQANTGTRAEAGDNKATKSSLSYLHTLLEQNGFPNVETVAPSGFPRPLLIGRRGQ